MAIRFELLLLIGWLGLACVWPRSGWTKRRLAAAVALVILTLAAKESWVMLP